MAEEPAGKDGEKTGGYGSGYGSKPKWMWWVLYIVIGGVVYYGIYAWYASSHKSTTGSLYGGSSSSGSLYGSK